MKSYFVSLLFFLGACQSAELANDENKISQNTDQTAGEAIEGVYTCYTTYTEPSWSSISGGTEKNTARMNFSFSKGSGKQTTYLLNAGIANLPRYLEIENATAAEQKIWSIPSGWQFMNFPKAGYFGSTISFNPIKLYDSGKRSFDITFDNGEGETETFTNVKCNPTFKFYSDLNEVAKGPSINDQDLLELLAGSSTQSDISELQAKQLKIARQALIDIGGPYGEAIESGKYLTDDFTQWELSKAEYKGKLYDVVYFNESDDGSHSVYFTDNSDELVRVIYEN